MEAYNTLCNSPNGHNVVCRSQVNKGTRRNQNETRKAEGIYIDKLKIPAHEWVPRPAKFFLICSIQPVSYSAVYIYNGIQFLGQTQQFPPVTTISGRDWDEEKAVAAVAWEAWWSRKLR
jgi:hypothetical protein